MVPLGNSIAATPVAGDPSALFKKLRPHMAALDVFMSGQVDRFEPEIREMAAYCLDTTGKRLRPMMVFACGWDGGETVAQDLVCAAGIVEMVHLATLVHDDIMDKAEIRRGRRTAAREYGANEAVLLGDVLFSQALHVASGFPAPDICRLVSESTRKVCSGEIMQTLRRRAFSISVGEYRRVIDLKTAELFRLSCCLGAKISGHEMGFVQAAEKFGRHLGIAYQIYDDLLDFVGDEHRIGKTLGTDVATGKLTLPLMLLLEKLEPGERDAMIRKMRDDGSAAFAASKQRMHDLGIASLVRNAIDDELGAALLCLENYPSLAPVPLMLEFVKLLQVQVASLHPSGHSA
jgi:octaprenyl-diphosphate synthase